jgi:hypothetical protein
MVHVTEIAASGAENRTIEDTHGTAYTPWSDGWAVGFHVRTREGKESYVYLNPSSDSDDGVSTAFLYHGPHGSPALDAALVHVDVSEIPA